MNVTEEQLKNARVELVLPCRVCKGQQTIRSPYAKARDYAASMGLSAHQYVRPAEHPEVSLDYVKCEACNGTGRYREECPIDRLPYFQVRKATLEGRPILEWECSHYNRPAEPVVDACAACEVPPRDYMDDVVRAADGG